MNIVQKEWKLQTVDDASVARLQQDLNIHPSLCTVLVGRGIDTFQKAKTFFRPSAEDLHDPFLMKDMDKAVRRITKAVEAKEAIRIFGDYDVDGTTSVALVYQFLKETCGADYPLSFYIPNRYTEGYGLSTRGVEDAAAQACSLMIVLDCGITAIDKIKLANELGIDVIVCDHHLPGQELPAAVAILNPKQADCNYPFKELSACGIGFKLIAALVKAWQLSNPNLHFEYLELVAASIASDIVPIVDENRVLAYFGLKKINENPSLSFQILKEVSGIERKMNIANLVFFIGPKINAAGRMNDAGKVVQFFISKDRSEQLSIAKALSIDNKERTQLDKSITAEALAMMEEDGRSQKKSIVLHHEEWHKGVVGIVASRILEVYYKPTLILTTSNGKVTGSARSVHGFDIHKAIGACVQHLESYGGHQFAAGLTMEKEQLPLFIEAFEQEVSASIQPSSLVPVINVDACIDLATVTVPFMKILEQFEPCGPQNLMPVFMSEAVVDAGGTKIVKSEHLQVYFKQNGVVVKGIAFRMAAWYDYIHAGNPVDILYHIERNEWKGTVYAEIRILDIRATKN